MEKVTRESGQAILEYVLLLAILLAAFTGVINLLFESNAIDALKKPLEKEFKYTYQYGHPEVRGQSDGGPKNVAQKYEPADQNQNFRIFINPPINE